MSVVEAKVTKAGCIALLVLGLGLILVSTLLLLKAASARGQIASECVELCDPYRSRVMSDGCYCRTDEPGWGHKELNR